VLLINRYYNLSDLCNTKNYPTHNSGTPTPLLNKFIEDETGCEIDSLNNKIEAHLGISGDDTEELLGKFIKQFGLSTEGFDINKHFYSEGELFGSGSVLTNIVIMIIKVVIWLVEILSFKQIRFNNNPQWYRPLDREITDLTFKQMLTWYLEKDYTAVEQTSYRLAMSSSCNHKLL
jgi:hypothetical protein